MLPADHGSDAADTGVNEMSDRGNNTFRRRQNELSSRIYHSHQSLFTRGMYPFKPWVHSDHAYIQSHTPSSVRATAQAAAQTVFR